MIHGKTCYNCGGNLKYDKEKKILICPFCGKTQGLDDSGEPATLKGARKAMKDGLFLKARNMLTELKNKNKRMGIADIEEDAEITLLLMLCGYQSASFAEYLQKNQKSPSAMNNVLNRHEFNYLLKALPEDKRQYITDILEFCMTAIEVCNENAKIAGNQEKLKSNARRMNYAGTRRRTSVFAQMDKEEKARDDRRKMLWEARNPDIVEENDYILSEDTAYRIFTLLTSDDSKEYHNRIRKRNAYLEERDKTRAFYRDVEIQGKAQQEMNVMNHTKEYLEKKIAGIREDLGKAQEQMDRLLENIRKYEQDL